jgi:hypothetical protein
MEIVYVVRHNTDIMDNNTNSELFEFIDKLFLNIYSYLPQETVANFLVKYSNLLYWRYSPHKGDWTIYPPNHEGFKFEVVTHSIEFNCHPFFPENFYKGYLEILNTETDDGNQTQDLKLNLFFREKSAALKAIELIDKGMLGLNCRKKEQTISRCLMVEYSSDTQDILNGISYKFCKDTIENRFRLLIYPNTLRIHFIK